MAGEIRVLYVDDEPGLLELAQEFLEQSGEFHVGTSTSAQEALDSPQIQSYDAIISDYQMPEMDGIAFLKEVRKRFGNLPFILFTGRGREEVVIEAINNGVDFYLQKGGDPRSQFAELVHKIRQAVTRRRAQDALRLAYDQITASEEELRGQYEELIRSEQQIRESETKFRELAELLPQIVFEMDCSFRITFVNNQAYIQTGYTPDDIEKGFFALSIVDPSQHAILKEKMENMVRGEHYEHNEYTICRKDGSTFPALIYANPVNKGEELAGFRGIIIDISDRKRAEDTLRESEEKYRTLVEVNQDVIYSLDSDGTVLYMSPKTMDQIGYRPDEIEGRNFTGFIHPEDVGKLVRNLQENSQIGSPVPSDQFRVRRKDGTYRWYEDTTINAIDPRGRQVVIGTLRDITERKLADDELFNSRQMLQSVIDTIPQRVFWKDRDSVFLGCNKPNALDAGFTDPADMVGRTDYDYTTAEIAELYRADDRQVMKTGQARINYEEPQVRPDGSKAWLRTSKVPLRNREGEIIGVLGTYEDITDYKRAQEALLESEAKYRDLADSLPQMVFEADLDLRVTYANRHALAIFGFTDEIQVYGKNVLAFIDPSQHADVRDSVQKILNGIPFEPKKYNGLRKDRSTFPVIIYSSPIYRNKTIIGFRGVVVDISDWNKMEDEVRESEEKFRALVEFSLDGILITDFKGKLLFANRAAGRIVDVEDYEALIGKRNVIEYIAPESQADVLRDFGKVAQGIDAYLVYYKLITETKREVWVECIGKKIRFGDADAMLVSLRDVTERRAVETALRESEAHYRLLANNVHDVIWTADMDMRLTYISPSVKELLGITPGEALAVSVNDSVTPESLRVLKEHHQEGMDLWHNGRASSGSRNVELEFHRKDGSTVWTDVMITPTFDDNGVPTGVVGVTRDISRRREAEIALRESENRFATIFRSNQVALTLVSLRDETFYDVNDAFVRNSGYSRDEVIGKAPGALGLFAEPDTINRIVSLLRSQGQVNGLEIKFRTKSQEIQTCLYSASIISMGGDAYVLSTVEDITERKRVEEALRQANKKLKILSSVTRHDIKNQLMMLDGFVTLLHTKHPDLSHENCFSRITIASNQITNLIDFTKEYEMVGVHAPVWQDARTLVETAAKDAVQGQITLINDLPAGMKIFADPLITKVFFNLADNAVRHGNTITRIRFSSEVREGCCIIVCEDDGVGIALHQKKKIFDPGYGKNTGFGLAISREILNITGITITETGEPGHGARFEMTVPDGSYRVPYRDRRTTGDRRHIRKGKDIVCQKGGAGQPPNRI